jgi:hypothetical protein
VGDVLQVIAEAAPDSEAEQLTAIESEPQTACFTVRAVDDDRMPAGPAESRFGVGDTAKLDGHCGHKGLLGAGRVGRMCPILMIDFQKRYGMTFKLSLPAILRKFS